MPKKKTKAAKVAGRRLAASQPVEKLESQNHRERMEALERIASSIDRLTDAIREGNRLRRRPALGAE
jgi:hypothetical protein